MDTRNKKYFKLLYPLKIGIVKLKIRKMRILIWSINSNKLKNLKVSVKPKDHSIQIAKLIPKLIKNIDKLI